MLIRSVHLKNVKSYDNLRVTFTAGVNAITGHNGAGKSTLVEAIGFALFNVLEYTKELFVREGNASGLVGIVFSSRVDGRDYLVERAIGSGPYRVADCESNLLLASGADHVQGFIRRHLGLGETASLEKIFRDAVGVPQGTLTAVFGLTPTPRKAVFDPLLQVEDYRTAYQNLADSTSWLKDRGQETAVTIATLSGLVATLPATRTRLAEIDRALGEKSEMLAMRKQALQAATVECNSHEARKLAAQQAEQRLHIAQMNQSGAATALVQAQSLLLAAREAAQTVQLHSAGHLRYLAAQGEQTRLAARRREWQALMSKRNDVAQRHAVAEATVANNRDRLAAILDATRRAELLQAPAERQQTLKAQLEAAIAQAAELRGAENNLANARKELDVRRARLAQLTTEVERAVGLAAQDERVKAQLAEINAKIEELTEACNHAMAQGMAARQHQEQLEAVETPLCPICKRTIDAHLRDELLQHDTLQRAEHGAKLREAREVKGAAEARKRELEESREAVARQLRTLAVPSLVDQCALEVATLDRQRTDAEQRVQQLSGAQSTVDSLRVELQALGDPISERSAQLAQAAQRATVEQQLATAQADVQRLGQELGVVDGQLLAYASLDAEVDANGVELAATLVAYQTVLAHRSLAETLPQRERDELAATAKAAEAQTNLAEAEVAHAQAGAAYSAAAHLLAQQAVNQHNAAVGGLTADLATLKQEKEKTAQELSRLEAEERKLRKAEVERDQIERRRKALEKMRNVIREAGPRITNLRIQRISAQAAEVFRELTGDYGTRLRWEEDYSIVLEIDGRERAFKSLSGGEQMVAALSVRLALLREMSGIKVAFFDEPTANLDPVRRERLAAQIAAIRGFEQVFVISHDDTFEASTVNVIRLEKQHGATRLLGHGV